MIILHLRQKRLSQRTNGLASLNLNFRDLKYWHCDHLVVVRSPQTISNEAPGVRPTEANRCPWEKRPHPPQTLLPPPHRIAKSEQTVANETARQPRYYKRNKVRTCAEWAMVAWPGKERHVPGALNSQRETRFTCRGWKLAWQGWHAETDACCRRDWAPRCHRQLDRQRIEFWRSSNAPAVACHCLFENLCCSCIYSRDHEKWASHYRGLSLVVLFVSLLNV